MIRIAWLLAVTGLIGIVTLRVITIDLTEGQALTEYWWGWLASTAVIIAGLWIASRKKTNT